MLKNWYAICDNDWIFDNKIKSELPLLLYISSLTAEKGYCFAGNSHLASKFKLHETSISKKIKKLSKLWYINLEYKYRWCEVIDRKIRLAKTPTVELQKCQSTISKNTKDNITSINNISNNRVNKFTNPSLEEIESYVIEKNINVDAKQFFNYFDVANWIDSKGNKVKNWKQKLLTWANYNKPKTETNSSSAYGGWN